MASEKWCCISNANYGMYSTETGPGHSVLLTGRHGSHSGIVANDWYDSLLKTYVNVVDDPTQQGVGSTDEMRLQ